MVRILITMLAVYWLVACGFQKTPAPRNYDTDVHPSNGAAGGPDVDAGEPEIACTDRGGCPGDRPYCTKENHCAQCLEDGACDHDLPRCEMSVHRCVECVTDKDCIDPGRPFCDDQVSHACVQCRTILDCTAAETPRCDRGQCGQCKSNDDCDHVPNNPFCDLSDSKTQGNCVECNTHADCVDPDKPQCTDHACGPCQGKSADKACESHVGAQACNIMPGKKQGSCVQCTVSNESACGDFVCDAKQHSCSKERRASSGICQPCVADSQCQRDHHCIELDFQKKDQGSFCLKRESTGCNEPFTVAVTAASVSGAADESYCGINTKNTTCDAVLDMLMSKDCQADKDCGDGNGDGHCGRVGPLDNKCTYACGISAQCPVGLDCGLEQGYCE